MISICCIVLSGFSYSIAQTIQPEIIVHLPAILYESSGIEVSNENNIWTHNDSGDSAKIYNIDTLGNILRTIYVDVDAAIDCEESTRDAAGNYYLGDFGNNSNNRTNLCIYKIPNPDTSSSDTLIPQLITFQYEDQLLFPPDSANMNFDCEAMFHFQDSLYLFSKNRGTSTFCKMYRLTDEPGDYVAELVDSFNTGTWITSADISQSGNRMVLLSETRLWMFSNISGTGFFEGDAQMFSMYFTQKEAVVFVNDSLLYITDEYLMGLGGNLYRLNLSSWINDVATYETTPEFIIYPNPATDFAFIEFSNQIDQYLILVSDLNGNKIIRQKNTIKIDVRMLSRGQYFFWVINNGIPQVVPLIIE